ncbi:MAG: hypothetical protein ACT4QA_00790 [Panacagrimonas sp.]
MNVLELNDTGLLLSDGARLLIESPGFAALDGKHLLVGEAARARSRLDPRRTSSRYWYQLEGSHGAPLGNARTHADLAYAQLLALRESCGDEPLILAVPGGFTREQLGLLLGLVEASGLKAQGLVDAAVAATSTVDNDPRVLHLDVEQHRFLLTVLDGGTTLARQSVEEIAKPGLVAVWDAVSRSAAQVFVQQTRFDPLHSANTEQLLFDALPRWLEALSSAPSAVLELASGGRTHRASLAREDLVQRLTERFETIAAAVEASARPRPTTLLLSSRASAVPGLAEHLEYATGLAPLKLDSLAPARGALAQIDRIVIPGSGLAHITRLPGRARVKGADAGSSEPTHALVGDRAQSLPRTDRDPALPLSKLSANTPGMLRRLDGKLWLDGTDRPGLLVNGKAVRLPARVGLGDRIECAGLALRLIEVMP